MRLRKLGFALFISAAALALAVPAFAQEATPESTPEAAPAGGPPLPGDLIIGDLQTPRGIAFDENGNLIVTVVGSGGDFSMTLPSPEGGEQTIQIGNTGAILSVAPDGTVTTLLQAVPSYASPSETVGLYRAIPHGNSLWVITTGGPGFYASGTIFEYDLTTLRLVTAIAMAGVEIANNPDGNEIDSNPTDLAWGADGTMYIVDAGANSLYSWTPEMGLSLVSTWPDNAVPTSVFVADNGDLYVGFLGAGLAPGAGRVERWSNGELAHTYDGLNSVTDVLVADGNLYAVELVRFGDQGPGPGGVIMLTDEGSQPVVDGLVSPFGIAQGPDGSLYVSFGTIAFAPGMTGGVVRLPGM